MKTLKFTEVQIAFSFRQAESGPWSPAWTLRLTHGGQTPSKGIPGRGRSLA